MKKLHVTFDSSGLLYLQCEFRIHESCFFYLHAPGYEGVLKQTRRTARKLLVRDQIRQLPAVSRSYERFCWSWLTFEAGATLRNEAQHYVKKVKSSSLVVSTVYGNSEKIQAQPAVALQDPAVVLVQARL